MNILGVDPGSTGSIVAIIEDMGTKVEFIEDMPTKKERKKTRVDVEILQTILLHWDSRLEGIDLIAVERVGAVPRDSPLTAFSFGHSVGSLMATLELTLPKARIELISPQRWRNALPFKILTGEKATLEQTTNALGCDPSVFTGPRGGIRQGRIDAALIALAMARLEG